MSSRLSDEMIALMTNSTGRVSDSQLLGFSEKLIEHLQEVPHLYRYSNAGKNSLKDLEGGTVYLSEIGRMDDIFEGLSMWTDYDSHLELNDIYECAYVKSFSENKCNTHMWAQYAQNFEGMCVEYDISLLKDRQALYHLFPVVYKTERDMEGSMNKLVLVMREKRFDSSDAENMLYLYLQKSKDWEFQKEWRLAVSKAQIERKQQTGDEKSYQLYNIDNREKVAFDCVSKVFLGPRMKIEDKEKVLAAVEKLNEKRADEEKAKVYVATIHETLYTLDYNEDNPIQDNDELY